MKQYHHSYGFSDEQDEALTDRVEAMLRKYWEDRKKKEKITKEINDKKTDE